MLAISTSTYSVLVAQPLFFRPAGELYDLLDMYEAEEAKARLAKMQPDELLSHLALQGEHGLASSSSSSSSTAVQAWQQR
jgi:hypothetical protein